MLAETNSKAKAKIFVLDTNVILHTPNSLLAFEDNIISICLTVLEELDKYKKGNEEINRNARDAIRLMDKLRKKARESGQKMAKGVRLPNGGKLQIFVNHTREINQMIKSLGVENIPDNRIIAVANHLMETSDKKVVLVSKDINVRLKADALGIDVQDYSKDKIQKDKKSEKLQEVEKTGDEIDKFYSEGGACYEYRETFYPNEFVLIKDKGGSSQSGIGIIKNGKIEKVSLSNRLGKISLRNKEQAMATHLLLDNEIKVICLVGGAGTGKTLLALAAGLELWNKEYYKGIIVSRPIIPMGKDIGYLPGAKDQKLGLWMQPIFDNLEFLLSCSAKGNRHNQEKLVTAKSLISNGVISLEALTYIRGRSLLNRFVIIDEAQNLTPHEVKTIITRCGEGSKFIFTGDPEQIDNPYLDSSSNGLSYLVRKSQQTDLAGHVFLSKSERSAVAETFSKLL